MSEVNKRKFNPIDRDKITENPGALQYPHHVGSPKVVPLDKQRVRSRALSAMEQQTDSQLHQIKKQMELLAQQARQIQERIEMSKQIYVAEMGFEPLMGHTYYLYQKEDGGRVLSLIGADEWGKTKKFVKYV